MNTDSSRELLRKASILKMRGMKLRALGDEQDQWEAVVAFHESAHKELALLELLQNPSPEVEAGIRIEACGLFLDARDPVNAALQWKLIPVSIHHSAVGADLLARLRPVFEAEHAKFVRAWAEFKKTLPRPGSLEGAKAAAIHRLCKAYPGTAWFWWAAYRHAEARSRWKEAKDALERARRLSPENVRYVALDVLLASRVFEPQQALLACRKDWERFRDISAEVNQMFALSLLRLSRNSDLRAQILEEVYDAVQRAETLAKGTSLGAQARLLRDYVEILRTGHVPTTADFARVGVVPVVAATKPVKLDELEEELIASCVPAYNDNNQPQAAAGF